MQKIKFIFIALLFANAQFANAQTNTLTINIDNITSSKGTIYIGIFKENTDFPSGKPTYQNILKCDGKSSVTTSISGVANGNYAITVYHDLNDNGKLDKNFIGVPKEPYAFSQNFHPKMSAPKFDNCKIKVASSSTSFNLRLID